jgi:hypothetical protein
MTTATATRQADSSSSSAPLPSSTPPPSSQEVWTASEVRRQVELAVKNGTNVIDAFDGLHANSTISDPNVEPAVEKDTTLTDDDPTISPDQDSKSNPDTKSDFDLKTPMTEEEEKKEETKEVKEEGEEEEEEDLWKNWLPKKTPRKEKKPKSLTIRHRLTTNLLEQNEILLEGLMWTNQELLKQNSHAIERQSLQNTTMIDRLVVPPVVFCGAEEEKRSSGGSKKEKEKEERSLERSRKEKRRSLITYVHIVLRVLSLMLLVVIAVQLGLIRGEGKSERRRTGFLGW